MKFLERLNNILNKNNTPVEQVKQTEVVEKLVPNSGKDISLSGMTGFESINIAGYNQLTLSPEDLRNNHDQDNRLWVFGQTGNAVQLWSGVTKTGNTAMFQNKIFHEYSFQKHAVMILDSIVQRGTVLI